MLCTGDPVVPHSSLLRVIRSPLTDGGEVSSSPSRSLTIAKPGPLFTAPVLTIWSVQPLLPWVSSGGGFGGRSDLLSLVVYVPTSCGGIGPAAAGVLVDVDASLLDPPHPLAHCTSTTARTGKVHNVRKIPPPP